MINFKFTIENPWGSSMFKSIRARHYKLFWHKVFEWQIYKYNTDIIGLTFNLTWRGQDHAGPEAELILFTYAFRVKIYDSRHWDYHNKRWEIYREQDEHEQGV